MSTNRDLNPIRNKWTVLSIHTCILITLILFSQFYPYFNVETNILIWFNCLLVVMLSVWVPWSWYRMTRSFFDPYILFFTAAILFNGGQAFLELFDLNYHGLLAGKFSSETLIKTLFLVMQGLASFHFGALFSLVISGNRIPSQQEDMRQRIQRPTSGDIRRLGWGLLVISSVPSLLLLREIAAHVMVFGYSSVLYESHPTGFSAASRILANLLVPAALFLLAGSKERRMGIIVSGITILSYAFLYFFLGKRGSASMALVAFAWLFHRSIHPLPKISLTSVGATILFIVFPVVQITRNISGADRLSLGFLLEAFFSIDNPVVAILSEMGTSMQIVAYTLELVPSYRDFDMGLGYLYGLFGVFPSLFWDVHPSVARGLPSSWLVWLVDPYFAARGGGLGFSFIAEAYLNFGWLGSLIALGCTSFFYVKLILWSTRTGEPAKIALMASFLSFVLFYARQDFNIVLRPLVWYAFIPYLGVHIVRQIRLFDQPPS